MNLKRNLIAASAAISILGLTTLTASAISPKLGIIPMGAYMSFSSSRHLQSGGGFGLGLAYRLNKKIGMEFDVINIGSKQKRGEEKNLNATFVSLNGLYFFKPLWVLNPYVSAGLGGIHVSVSNSNNPSTQAAVNLGAGFSYSISPQIAIRVGANDYVGLTSNMTNDIGAHAGLAFYFGKSSNTNETASVPAATAENNNNSVPMIKVQKSQSIVVDKKGVYVLNDGNKSKGVYVLKNGNKATAAKTTSAKEKSAPQKTAQPQQRLQATVGKAVTTKPAPANSNQQAKYSLYN